MNASTSTEQMVYNPPVLDIEPDILDLGRYLARRRGLTLEQYIEYLITSDAAHGRLLRLPELSYWRPADGK